MCISVLHSLYVYVFVHVHSVLTRVHGIDSACEI